MKLITIKINSLYGHFNKEIHFNEDINYFIGINGSGKTSILKIMHEFFRKNTDYFITLEFKTIAISYKVEGVLYKYTLTKDENNQLKISKESNDNIAIIENLELVKRINILTLGLEKEYQEEKIIRFFKVLKDESSLDPSLRDEVYNTLAPIERIEDLLEKRGRKYLEEKNKKDINTLKHSIFRDLRTSIARDLEKSISKKSKSVNRLEKEFKLFDVLKEMDNSLEKSFIDDFPKDIRTYLKVINSFLEETNKKIIMDYKTGKFIINIKFKEGDEKIKSFKHLSSGEKELLILMTSIAYTPLEKFVVLIDEPEISLHMSWQREISQRLKEISGNKNIQFIMATHSPDITRDAEDDKFIPFYPLGMEEKNESIRPSK